MTSFSLCPSVDVNSVFPLFFCLFVPLLISLSFCICPFYSVLFFCIFLSCSPPPAILPTLIFILRRVLHCCLCDLTTPHLTYFCFILYLGLFIFIYFLCACFPTSLSPSVWFSVLLVFMAAPSLSSHFLPQIAAAEQQPDSRAAAAAATVAASSAGPSWRLHARATTAPTSTAATDWGFRHQTRARSAPPSPLFLPQLQHLTVKLRF